MKEYLKMSDVFGSDIVTNGFFIGCHVDGEYCEIAECGSVADSQYIYNAINSHDELVAEVERLRQALIDAATSLETIHMRSYGEDSFLDSKHQMRSYAESRAKVARQALSEQ